MQAKSDDFWNKHGRRLAEHGGFGFNSADAPAEDAERIYHRRVRIGPDNGIRISLPAVAVWHRANHAR